MTKDELIVRLTAKLERAEAKLNEIDYLANEKFNSMEDSPRTTKLILIDIANLVCSTETLWFEK